MLYGSVVGYAYAQCGVMQLQYSLFKNQRASRYSIRSNSASRKRMYMYPKSNDVRGSRNETRGRYSTNTERWHRTCTRAAVRAYLFEAACLSTCVLIGEYAF